MSEPENFLARWSRLKRETTFEVRAGGKHAPVEALHVVDEPPAPAFDPASLPSIELINAATDIRPFLEDCVPEELTRAALRTTWSADPAIRDFVGIAEGQWDFNDPASIPGFGVHAAADYLGSLAAHGAESLNTPVGSPAESSQMVGRPISEDTDPADVASQTAVVVTDPSHETAVGTPAGHTGDAALFAHHNAAEEGDLRPRMTRSHGGALPE
jgi:hypothetical protein